MPATGLHDIVETAVGAGSFSTLTAALKAAGLVDALKGPGPFTVFAPNDDAFAQLPAGTLDSLLKDIPKLTAILRYHVVSGSYASSDVKAKTVLKTLQGETVTLEPSNNTVKVNDATVIQPDVRASNGIIHVIDRVVLPA